MRWNHAGIGLAIHTLLSSVTYVSSDSEAFWVMFPENGCKGLSSLNLVEMSL